MEEHDIRGILAGGVAYVDERRAEAAGPTPPGPRCPACAHAEVPEVVLWVGEAGPGDAQGRRGRRWCEGSGTIDKRACLCGR